MLCDHEGESPRLKPGRFAGVSSISSLSRFCSKKIELLYVHVIISNPLSFLVQFLMKWLGSSGFVPQLCACCPGGIQDWFTFYLLLLKTSKQHFITKIKKPLLDENHSKKDPTLKQISLPSSLFRMLSLWSFPQILVNIKPSSSKFKLSKNEML